jgi:hypothetical protein
MAIFGLNFNQTPIPAEVQARFARERVFPVVGSTLKVHSHLVGVCNTREELTGMWLQANNGARTVDLTPARKINGQTWFGVYAGYAR